MARTKPRNSLLKWLHPLLWGLATLRLVLFLLTVSIYYFSIRLLNVFYPVSQEFRASVRRKCLHTSVAIMGFIYKVQDERPEHLVSEKGYLYICNHRSWSDPLIALGLLDAVPVSKAEVKNLPIIGAGMTFTGIVYLERMNRESHKKVRREISNALTAGTSVLLFPEGTTFTSDETGLFKVGSFEQAISAGAGVIPMVIEYKDRYSNYWDVRTMWQQFVSQCGKLYNRCHVWIGPPIDTRDYSAPILRDTVHRIINDKIAEIHSQWGHDRN